MAYYMQGDYRTGGYYAGDPGLFSFAKRLIKKAPAIITGAVTGGPAGAIAGAFSKIPRGPMPGAANARMAQQGFIAPAAGRAIGRGVLKGLKKYGPGAAAGAVGSAALDRLMGPNGECCPPGYHFAKDGSGRCVRNRRMNVCNPRALRRSIRRLQGFEKLAKRTLKSTSRVRVRRKTT